MNSNNIQALQHYTRAKSLNIQEDKSPKEKIILVYEYILEKLHNLNNISNNNANILIEEIIKILVYLKIPLSNNENNSPNLSNISNILDRFYSNMLNRLLLLQLNYDQEEIQDIIMEFENIHQSWKGLPA